MVTVLRDGLATPETPQERRTRRVAALPRDLRRMQPSAWDKCRAEGHCRMCHRPEAVRPVTRHHVVPLSWWTQIALPWRQYRHAPANVVPLCRPCHDIVEHRDPEIRTEARRMVRRSMTQSEIAFAIAVATKAWFDHHYPT